MDLGEEVKIHLVENYPCDTLKKLEEREGFYIRNLECVNKLVAGRTKQEYYEDTKEVKLKYQKQYYEDFKEDIYKYRKQWYQDNKEDIDKYRKQYYEDNKNRIKARNTQKIECECGAVVSRGNIAAHRKSQKHKKYIESL